MGYKSLAQTPAHRNRPVSLYVRPHKMTSPSSSEKKKEIEKHYLDRLRASMLDFPAGRIEPTEEPDFLVHGDNRVIGIELTELHKETPGGAKPQQALEAMRHRVVTKAQELYIAANLPPVNVSIFMNDGYDECDHSIRWADVHVS